MIIKPLVLGLSLLNYIGHDYNYRPSPNYFNPLQQRSVERPIEKPDRLDIFGLPNFDEECPDRTDEYGKVIERIQQDFDEINKTIKRLEKILESKRNFKKR